MRSVPRPHDIDLKLSVGRWEGHIEFVTCRALAKSAAIPTDAHVPRSSLSANVLARDPFPALRS